jgi:Sec-independent protein translocase protein TatA
MKSMGKGVKTFKDAMDGMDQEIKDPQKNNPSRGPDKDKPSDKPVS